MNSALSICLSICNTVFSGYMLLFSNILHQVRVHFLRKFLLSLQWVKFAFVVKSRFSNFSLNLFFRFFWSCIWWQAFKNLYKWLFCVFKENSYYPQNGGKWGVSGPKTVRLNFFLKLSIEFFWNCTW